MKLVQFSVSKYRSITEAYKLPLEEYVVLVGPNNAGKSNVLRAMVLSLKMLTEGRWARQTGRRPSRYRHRPFEDFDYRWSRDFPLSLQEEKPDGVSAFTLEFELTSEELDLFNEQISVRLNSNLKMKVSMRPRGAKLEVLMQGKAKQRLMEHIDDVVAFIAERVSVQYIPSIRTSDIAVEVVENMLGRELQLLEQDDNYHRLIESIEAAQQPILRDIEGRLTQTIQSFIPDVQSISLDTRELRRAIRRSCRVIVNDGTSTDLELKGDGIQSLTAISLLRHATETSLKGRNLILAIEEPESHLHPGAIHKLAEVLQEIAASQQVIVTTHSQELVDRRNVRRNILVQDGRATPSEKISEVRKSLGIRMSDNLSSAFLVLLVEGKHDMAILRQWISSMSTTLKHALAQGTLVIDDLSGAKNLRYQVSLYRNCLCNVFAFVDNDRDGQSSLDKAKAAGLLTNSQYLVAMHKGMNESEMEDFVVPDCYKEHIEREFGVNLAPCLFRSRNKKWSDRMKECFQAQGKPWTKSTVTKAKEIVSHYAAEAELDSLKPVCKSVLDSLVRNLEQYFTDHSQAVK